MAVDMDVRTPIAWALFNTFDLMRLAYEPTSAIRIRIHQQVECLVDRAWVTIVP